MVSTIPGNSSWQRADLKFFGGLIFGFLLASWGKILFWGEFIIIHLLCFMFYYLFCFGGLSMQQKKMRRRASACIHMLLCGNLSEGCKTLARNMTNQFGWAALEQEMGGSLRACEGKGLGCPALCLGHGLRPQWRLSWLEQGSLPALPRRGFPRMKPMQRSLGGSSGSQRSSRWLGRGRGGPSMQGTAREEVAVQTALSACSTSSIVLSSPSQISVSRCRCPALPPRGSLRVAFTALRAIWGRGGARSCVDKKNQIILW